jgi:hypothetical protein
MTEDEVRWVRDTTGRFERRPWYTQAYLDRRCEETLFGFLEDLYGQITIPVPTGAIIRLIERDAADLDLYADLTGEGDGVEGVTYFFGDGRPKVRVVRELSEQRHRIHRLRNTLAHEYAHVCLHSELWRESNVSAPRACRAEDIVSESVVDWLEWQASYCAAALLMPKSRLRVLVAAYARSHGSLPYQPESLEAIGLEQRAVEAFDVSQQAVGVRLTQLGYVKRDSER